MPVRKSLLPVCLLGALFAVAAAIQTSVTYRVVYALRHSHEMARTPFRLVAPEGTITRLEDEAKAAGLQDGDTLRELDGARAFGLLAPLAAVESRKPGDMLPLVVERGGQTIQARVPLGRAAKEPAGPEEWTLSLSLAVAMPWLCLLLGFGVALRRPHDPLAWLLLLLTCSFVAIFGDSTEYFAGSNTFVKIVTACWFAGLKSLWPLAMMLFGQYFPNRTVTGWVQRGLQAVIGVPLAVSSLVNAVMVSSQALDVRSAPTLAHLDALLSPSFGILAMVAVGSFFPNIFSKMRLEKRPDARRRLKLLYAGMTAALTPMFLVLLFSLATGRRHLEGAVFLVALLGLLLFPVTLAYVIVVERALDVSVVIRQGLQYALASKAVVAFQVLATVGILALMAYGSVRATGGPGLFQTVIVGGGLVIGLKRFAEWLQKWLDSRFFRQAVDAERMLGELSENVRTMVEVKPLMERVSCTVASALHITQVAALVQTNGHFSAVHSVGWDQALTVRFPAVGPLLQKLKDAPGPVTVSAAESDQYESDEAGLKMLHTELLLPLNVKGRVLGFLSLGPRQAEAPYSANDQRVLRSVGIQTGLALENTRLTAAFASEVAQKERLNRELEIAREVQDRLFPHDLPPIAGLEYSGSCRPALSIGGDYYDFIPMSGGRLGVAIGDVSGKGVAAALMMANLQASLRGLAAADPPSLAPLMGTLNRLILASSPQNKYCTFFYSVWDPANRTLTYVNGGHNAPMVFRGNTVLRLEAGGPVVGLFAAATYEQASITLEPGDTVVLFTDGISEAMNSADEEFGDERIEATVHQGSASPSALIQSLMESADAFAAGEPQHDDMTLVVLKIAP